MPRLITDTTSSWCPNWDSIIEDFRDGIENGSGSLERLMRISGEKGASKTALLRELEQVAKDEGMLVVDEVATSGLCERIVQRITSSDSSKVSAVEDKLKDEIGLDPFVLRRAIRDFVDQKEAGILITLDDVNDVVIDEIRALAVAVQHSIREDLDIAFVFAGTPAMVTYVISAPSITFLRRAYPVELRGSSACSY